jgi:hypothetical protein
LLDAKSSSERLRYLSLGAWVYAIVNFLEVLIVLVVCRVLLGMDPRGVLSSSDILSPSPEQIMTAVIFAALAFVILCALLQFLFAYYLKARRNYRTCIGLAVLTTMGGPMGVAMAIWALVVLLKPEVRALFDQSEGYYVQTQGLF